METFNSWSRTLQNGKLLLPILSAFVGQEIRDIRSKKKHKKEPVIEDSKLTISALKERIVEFNHGDEDLGDDDLFHPSQIGGCRRKWWLENFKAPRETVDSDGDLLRSHLTFEIGTYFHILFQNLCLRAGVLKQREVPILSPKKQMIGHADGLLLINGKEYILEIKTANGRNFILISSKPKEEHLLQLHAYMLGLNVERGIIVYYNKDTSATKEFVVKYDPAIGQEVKVRINEHFKNVRKVTLPRRDYQDANKAPCNYCPYMSLCYSKSDMQEFLAKLPKPRNIRFK